MYNQYSICIILFYTILFYSIPCLSRPAFPPALVMFAKPLVRVLTVVLGKGARLWWRRLPEHQKITFKQLYQNNKYALTLYYFLFGSYFLMNNMYFTIQFSFSTNNIKAVSLLILRYILSDI